ncbi:hypothetical protein EDB83DRAFT_2315133 [Lactarius deliciosus]|nr:hypothetical protein EDB83DRAFT_2315133 [Lactarius deliciosus]
MYIVSWGNMWRVGSDMACWVAVSQWVAGFGWWACARHVGVAWGSGWALHAVLSRRGGESAGGACRVGVAWGLGWALRTVLGWRGAVVLQAMLGQRVGAGMSGGGSVHEGATMACNVHCGVVSHVGRRVGVGTSGGGECAQGGMACNIQSVVLRAMRGRWCVGVGMSGGGEHA